MVTMGEYMIYSNRVPRSTLSAQKTPEMNRSRGVDVTTCFYFFRTPNSREVIVLRQFSKKFDFLWTKNPTFSFISGGTLDPTTIYEHGYWITILRGGQWIVYPCGAQENDSWVLNLFFGGSRSPNLQPKKIPIKKYFFILEKKIPTFFENEKFRNFSGFSRILLRVYK